MPAELRALRGDPLDVWGDAGTRRAALEDVARAWQHGRDERLTAAVARVDAAVTAGLAALGMPRGPVAAIRLVRPLAPFGLKHPGCSLDRSGTYMRLSFDLYHQPDAILRTWIHESIHARQPYTPDYLAELIPHRGFEEGLADGLAGWITSEQAGMEARDPSYAGYVRAYRALATVLRVTPAVLWRQLWVYPHGRVRAELPDLIMDRGVFAAGRVLTGRARIGFIQTADDLFRSGRTADDLSDSALEERWHRALR